ncbi:MAG TPA: maleylpyruvate isomerase family mycothiol-dependent enzyme [Actinomycetota bacterium]|jgi:uncharacterized protein (TIGR03083 family)
MADESPSRLPRPDLVGGGASTDALEALRDECEEVSMVVVGLSEADFSRPTRCAAWTVKELLAHMYWGLNRAKRWLAEPPPEAADADSVGYWRSYDPLEDAPGIADRATQRAAEYASGNELAMAWDGLWREVVESAGREDRSRVVSTWGPTLTLDEFLKTRVLEITVHRMDLEDALGQKGWGTDQAVSIVDDTLEGLLGEQPPSDLEWDVVEFIEAGTGRRSLTSKEREILGALADRFPLLG